jgi:hypothetical protein
VDADIGVVSITVLVGGDKSEEAAPDPAAPPVVLPEDPPEGATGRPDGPFVADSEPGSELGAREGGLGKVVGGPFVIGSEPGVRGGGLGKVDIWAEPIEEKPAQTARKPINVYFFIFCLELVFES